MSVRERLEDAVLLWKSGRKTGAWIQVLIAAAATSRARFPDKGDREAFCAFIREVTPTIFKATAAAIPGGITIHFENPAGGVSLDRILYAHLRCTLVHEAVMPEEVKLCESRLADGRLVGDFSGGGTKANPLTIPDFFVLNLARAVADAPENAKGCAGLFGPPA